MKPKPYNTEEQPALMAAEPAAVYGRNAGSVDDVRSSSQPLSKPGRMTVDEYFAELREVLHKKYEELQS